VISGRPAAISFFLFLSAFLSAITTTTSIKARRRGEFGKAAPAAEYLFLEMVSGHPGQGGEEERGRGRAKPVTIRDA